MAQIGVVIIGRNEGDRLRACLESISGRAAALVYVDSGSSDDSVALAAGMGVAVVELAGAAFTAARARNAGFRRLRAIAPQVELVQFVDGDCELAASWLAEGAAFLRAQPRVAVVCGRLREKYPARSVYNMLCDIEWDAPAGASRSCGGIAMMRADAFEVAQGFNETMIAGEEPELCVRLRAAGWSVWRLDQEMGRHDAAMSRFGQWWKRALRCGYAFALGAQLHGAPPERHCVREWRSAWLWGLFIPVAIVALAASAGGWLLLLALVYPLQVARLALSGERSPRENWWRAWFLVLGKFPEMLGQLRFLVHRYIGGQPRLIEHK
jgi:GT2 family glycosyltransferase